MHEAHLAADGRYGSSPAASKQALGFSFIPRHSHIRRLLHLGSDTDDIMLKYSYKIKWRLIVRGVEYSMRTAAENLMWLL